MPQHAYIEGTLGVYELNQIDLLRDVFVWAYERSCQRYLAIAQTMVEPDPLKIKYREALIQAVQTIVKGLRQPSPAVIAEVAQDYTPEAGQAALRELLTLALQQLHEGSIARYRIDRLHQAARVLQQQDQLPIVCWRGLKTETPIKRIGLGVDGVSQ